ncbi:lysozyme [Photorhabdus laumondii subsp. laumondii]|uniref:Lysozyme n=1 Tax=Photorhabdus laumondii subsp. laumondii TaxID=141679 RepID=A0A6L9JQ02_PHOLM|nr:glycoside hydrolase family 104 protein [Photorhabdus laumondii]MCC8385323.1 glycoside hydrolase family 104 protein [Photorhabdus laumondii]MCC8414083.1 glycoside hydrolase family 104 protein [Photorhabdus laumondii]NDK96982.1 lysozyme [Photorhabdus laumondii subsp. laumondii]NDL23195.1 lysozyme [Photorhabdus laumondii subsp. laumondii]NDL32176.1 lysozyme [Photorhabdus laumondii subsp. laumondii]
MAETIDSLLVSLGLETDAKSFRKANDAIGGVRDGILQLAAAAGAGLGTKALTAGVSGYALEMKRLSNITGFTIKQIQGLEFAMRRLRLPPEAAHELAKKIPELQHKAKFGLLGDKAYWGNEFDPSLFAKKAETSKMQALEYLVGSYEKMDYDKRTFLREGIGGGSDDPMIRLLEKGSKFLDESMKTSNQMPSIIDDKLLESSQKFNDEMALLETNFNNLTTAMGKDLIPIINKLLESINGFIKENPEVSKAILGAAAVGTGAVAVKAGTSLINRLLPGGKVPKVLTPAASAAEAGWLRAALGTAARLATKANVVLSVITPANSFYSDDDIRAMSDPEFARKKYNLAGRKVPFGEISKDSHNMSVMQMFQDPAIREAQEKLNKSLKTSVSDIEQYLQDKNVRDYLDAIAAAEGTDKYPGGGYNTKFGGGQFYGYADHPRQLMSFTQSDGKQNQTSAAGRYQFTRGTWDEVAGTLGLTDFSPRNQDLAAIYLIKKRGQLDNVVAGDFNSATSALGKEWASLPSSNYAQPTRSYDEMESYYARRDTAPELFKSSSQHQAREYTVNQEVNLNFSGSSLTGEEIENHVNRALRDAANNAEQSFKSGGY